MDPHTALAIAQIVFYAPAVPLAVLLMWRNGRLRPRMAWWPLIPFTMMRLAGGPVVIAMEKKGADVGLVAAAAVLLNVGVIPLIVADLGLTRIILMDNYSHSPVADRAAGLLRLAIVAAAALLAAGGGLSAQGGPGGPPPIGHGLTLAGYIVFAVELVVLSAMQLYFLLAGADLGRSGRKVLHGTLLASPFILVRTLYGILGVVFQGDGTTRWNPVFGSAVAFGLMALLMEYVALCAYLYTGFSMPPDRGLGPGGGGEARAAAKT